MSKNKSIDLQMKSGMKSLIMDEKECNCLINFYKLFENTYENINVTQD